MNADLIQELKTCLEKAKSAMENELKKIAKKDEKLPGDWDTRFPQFSDNETGSGALEKAADEVEEYENLLPVEQSLELRLRDIDLALEKIQKGQYGKCETCGKDIPEERLRVYPEARFCLGCDKK